MRILLVDDDPAARRLLACFLRRSGFAVAAEAGDGGEALRILHQTSPDLIITDCQMPRMDGLALLRALRGRGEHTPAIMLSGQSSPAVVSSVLRYDQTAYLSKPFQPARLLEAIERLAGVAA